MTTEPEGAATVSTASAVPGMGLFPDQNPHPVLRMSEDGILVYANAASRPIEAAWRVNVGDPLPADVARSLRIAAREVPPGRIEVQHDGRTFDVLAIHVVQIDAYNLYGTDITAQKAIDKFPNQNPNPVLRLTRAGHMTYANPASVLVRKALGAQVGEVLDPAVFERVLAALDDPLDPTMEVDADGTIYRLRVVSVYEFDSINLYGTDITAVRQVEALSAANDRLLRNILPTSIAERLRAGETLIADRFDDMAVLFADVVGFTELSSGLEPTDVVTLLNRVFTACDELADRFGLEKIKTVGDAYMVAGGLEATEHERQGHGSATRSHAADVADMGLAMLEELTRLRHGEGIGLEMRVGMHVGPAVAGVIGLKKFIYDIWGDTVNTASRMESTGVPGRIQTTRATYERLADAFEFEQRGLVEVKGKGQVETWFLLGRRSAAGV